MTAFELGLISLPVMLLLILGRVPIMLAMFAVGVVGQFLILGSWTPFLAQLKHVSYLTFSSYSLSVIPMFLLMGQFVSRGGLSQALFSSAKAFVASQGRCSTGGHCGLWWFWCYLRVIFGNGGNYGAGGITRFPQASDIRTDYRPQFWQRVGH